MFAPVIANVVATVASEVKKNVDQVRIRLT